jgi:hypothetical protein
MVLNELDEEVEQTLIEVFFLLAYLAFRMESSTFVLT